MRTLRSKSVCPVEGAGGLDMKIRKWFHNPVKILKPYIKDDMSVLDFGCGPGFFTIEIARMLNGTGKVVAADLQQGMLDKLRIKIEKYDLGSIIQLHKCFDNYIGLDETFDFILVFYMLHEIIDQQSILKELKSLLKPNGKIMIVEPKVHVPQKDFEEMEKKVIDSGFMITERPNIFFSMTMVLSIF